MAALNKSTPVTVLMPVYNGAKYLRESIDSILGQTYTDFVFLIINDGSIDATEKIILSYNDSRIKYVNNDENIGLVRTLNKGVSLTETEFLVRMDADDIAVKQRLEWQIEFMDKNPDIGVSGGLLELFGLETGVPAVPFFDDDIKAALIFSNPLCHPAVIMRTHILKEKDISYGVPFDFNDNYGHKVLEMEDGALWHKLKSVTKFANINKVLIKYRREGQNLTTQKSNIILLRAEQYFAYYLSELDIKPSEEILLMHVSPGYYERFSSPGNIEKFRLHLNEVLLSNKKCNVYPQHALEKIVTERWENLFYYLPSLGIKHIIQYWKCDKKVKGSHLKYFVSFLFKKKLLKR